MKTIKSALLGTKSLIDTNPEVLLVQLKEILKAHRELLINRLMGDVPTYLDYKFNVKADKKMVELVKDRLLDLKKSNADLDTYDSIVQQVLNRSVTHLTNEPFYVEIDEYLSQYVKPQQLKFVS
jgi:hypothetical protein